MKKSSWIILGIICVLAVSQAAIKMFDKPQPSDEEQIHLLLAKAQSAVERKDLGDILSCISTEYSDKSGLNYGTLRLQAIEAFRAEGSYDVMLRQTTIKVKGKIIHADTEVSVYLVSHGYNRHRLFTRPLSITLRKEKAKRWLVFPDKKWKVVSVDGLPHDLAE